MSALRPKVQDCKSMQCCELQGRITSSDLRLRLHFVCILGITEEYRIPMILCVIHREIKPVLIFLHITASYAKCAQCIMEALV